MADCYFKLWTVIESVSRFMYIIITMDLIHYLLTPLILFHIPYTLDLLPYYLSIANGAGGVGIFELLVFKCFV